MHTHRTAPTQFVEAAGIRFAYRRFGATTDIPLLFFMHFTGTMDSQRFDGDRAVHGDRSVRAGRESRPARPQWRCAAGIGATASGQLARHGKHDGI